MSKYNKTDHGNVIDGAMIVWIDQAAPGDSSAASKAAAAKAQAAALVAAANAGVPFCQRCDPPSGGPAK